MDFSVIFLSVLISVNLIRERVFIIPVNAESMTYLIGSVHLKVGLLTICLFFLEGTFIFNLFNISSNCSTDGTISSMSNGIDAMSLSVNYKLQRGQTRKFQQVCNIFIWLRDNKYVPFLATKCYKWINLYSHYISAEYMNIYI